MVNIEKSLELLGMPATDKVSRIKGVVTSVCFDLYGCVQALLSCGVAPDGKLGESYWLDVSRLTVDGHRVMQMPHFEIAKGPQDKPIPFNR